MNTASIHNLIERASAPCVGKRVRPALRFLHIAGRTASGTGSATVEIMADGRLLHSVQLELGTEPASHPIQLAHPTRKTSARLRSITGAGALVSVVGVA